MSRQSFLSLMNVHGESSCSTPSYRSSVWITVAMTFERYIAVSRPLRASQICTIKRARYTLGLIVVIFAVINSHFLWTFHLSSAESHCIPVDTQSLFVKYFTLIDSFKYSFCPLTLLITLNILIIKSLIQSRHSTTNLLEDRRTTISSKSSSISSSSTSTNNQSGKVLRRQTQTELYAYPSTNVLAYRRINRRLTTMLLAVSFAFCICSMPIAIMQLFDAIFSDTNERSATMTPTIQIGKIIAEISQYVNHCKSRRCFTGEHIHPLDVLLFQLRISSSTPARVVYFVTSFVGCSPVLGFTSSRRRRRNACDNAPSN